MRRNPWRVSYPDFPDLMTRFSRLKLSSRLCNFGLNQDRARSLARLMSKSSRLYVQVFQTHTLGATLDLGLNPNAARPVARFMSRLSRPYDKTFKIQTLRATMTFGSKSRCGATLGATHVQIFQTICPDFPDSNTRRYSALWVIIWMRRDSCPVFPDLMSRLSRLKHSARLSHLGLNPDATQPLARFISRLSRPYDKVFKTQALVATMQLWSKSG